MENNTKNFYDSWVDSQKKMFDAWKENTSKFPNNNSINETLEKGSEFFKNWLNQQMEFLNTNKQSENTENPWMGFYNNWMNQQVNMVKEMNENARKMFSGFNMPSMPGMPNMPWMNGNFNMFNPNMMNMGAEMKNNMDNMMSTYSNWANMMSKNYQEMMNRSNSGEMKNFLMGMNNNAEAFSKFFELWMPVLRSLQDKSFTPDMFKNVMNPAVYKEFMDKMFGFMPDSVKNMFEQGTANMQNNMNNMMDAGKNFYGNFRSGMSQAFPFNGNDFFAQSMNAYNQFYNNLQSTAAPLSKLMTPGMGKEQMEVLSEISNKMVVFNLKNSHMQYMIYTTGIKAMEQISEKLYEKARNGEEFKGMSSLYQEWLNTNDKVFVELFESDEYSQNMAELNQLSLSLKKQIDMQTEKMFANVPLVPRSEMDELYKTIYELKKQVKNLERQLNNQAETRVSEEKENKSTTTAKKSAKNA